MAIGLSIAELKAQFPRGGKVDWIGVRPERRQPMTTLSEAQITKTGIVGDRHSKSNNRTITHIQAEHLPVIASLAGAKEVTPQQMRRNIVVSGINLLALKDREFRIGTTLLKGTGLCVPCSFMEETFGPGGYNATRGHGGITVKVIETGTICVGDSLIAI